MAPRCRNHWVARAARRLLAILLLVGLVLPGLPAPPARADGPTNTLFHCPGLDTSWHNESVKGSC
jgi:hypothetical protein